jgi:hypothetical protein
MLSTANRARYAEEFLRHTPFNQKLSLDTGQKEPDVVRHVQSLFLTIKKSIGDHVCPPNTVRVQMACMHGCDNDGYCDANAHLPACNVATM